MEKTMTTFVIPCNRNDLNLLVDWMIVDGGMMYDEDFECVYGMKWEPTGIQLNTEKARIWVANNIVDCPVGLMIKSIADV